MIVMYLMLQWADVISMCHQDKHCCQWPVRWGKETESTHQRCGTDHVHHGWLSSIVQVHPHTCSSIIWVHLRICSSIIQVHLHTCSSIVHIWLHICGSIVQVHPHTCSSIIHISSHTPVTPSHLLLLLFTFVFLAYLLVLLTGAYIFQWLRQ